MYQARILDKDRKLKAVLPGVQWAYERQINNATAIEVHIPREEVENHITQDHPLVGFLSPWQPAATEKKPQPERTSREQYAQIASYLQIVKPDGTKVTGKITGRQLGDIITVTALTEEVLLEANRTPAQYGKVWEGWDLADVAKDALDNWATVRIKDKTQWQDYMTGSSNIDLDTEPGLIMLAKQGNGRYHEQGHITLKMPRTNFADFLRWDRVRWSADSDGLHNPDKIVWTSIQTSTDGINFSEEFDGGLPEEVGYALTGTSDHVWVRINLHTNDTESPDPNDNPVGQTPVIFACEVIARTESAVDINSVGIPAEIGEVVTGLDADYQNALLVLAEACKQTGCEFTVRDGVINIAKRLGRDRTKEVLLRAGTNMEVAGLGDDDENLVNVLTALGPGSGINRLEIVLRNEESIAGFGEYPKTIEFNADSLASLEEKAQEYLNKHSEPVAQFEVVATFEYGKEPSFEVGDKVKVVDPKTGIITESRIMREQRTFGGQGVAISLELGKANIRLTDVIRREKPKDGKDGKPGKPGRPGPPGEPGQDFETLPPATPVWGDYTFTETLNLAWHQAEHATGYEIRNNLNWGNESGMIWQGYAHEYRFVPTTRTMILYLRSLNVAGEYSENYDTLNISLTKPITPNLPTVKEFFTAIQISIVPIANNPAILGYRIYLNDVAYTAMAGQTYTYKADPGTEIEVRAAAYDCIGEGDKTAIVMAETHYIDDDDLPDEVIKARHIETTELVTKLAAIEEAYIDMANILDLTVENESGLFKFDPADGLVIDTQNFKLIDGEAYYGGEVTVGGGKYNLVDEGFIIKNLITENIVAKLYEEADGSRLELYDKSGNKIIELAGIYRDVDIGNPGKGELIMRDAESEDMVVRLSSSKCGDLLLKGEEAYLGNVSLTGGYMPAFAPGRKYATISIAENHTVEDGNMLTAKLTVGELEFADKPPLALSYPMARYRKDGIWLGNGASDPVNILTKDKLKIPEVEADNYIHKAGNAIIYHDDREIETANTTWTKMFEATVGFDGEVKVSYNKTIYAGEARTYKNDSPVGPIRGMEIGIFDENMSCQNGDKIQLYGKAAGYPNPNLKVKDFKLSIKSAPIAW